MSSERGLGLQGVGADAAVTSSVVLTERKRVYISPDPVKGPSEDAIKAIQDGNIEKLKEALKSTNINNRSSAKDTLLLHAVGRGDTELDQQIVEILLEAGANPNLAASTLTPINTFHTNSGRLKGETPLMYAASKGHVNVMRLLVEEGALLDTMSSSSGDMFFSFSALQLAAEGGQLASVNFLLEAGAKNSDKYYESALYQAARNGDIDIVEVLLKGKDTSAKVEAYKSMLTTALNCQQTGLLQHILEKAEGRVEVDYLTSKLIDAADYGGAEAVSALLNHGADPNKSFSLMSVSAKTKANLSLNRQKISTIQAYDLINKADAKAFGKFMADESVFSFAKGENLHVDKHILKYTLEKIQSDPTQVMTYTQMLQGLLTLGFKQNADALKAHSNLLLCKSEVEKVTKVNASTAPTIITAAKLLYEISKMITTPAPADAEQSDATGADVVSSSASSVGADKSDQKQPSFPFTYTGRMPASASSVSSTAVAAPSSPTTQPYSPGFGFAEDASKAFDTMKEGDPLFNEIFGISPKDEASKDGASSKASMKK